MIEGKSDERTTLRARPSSDPVAKSLKGCVETGEDRLEHAVICRARRASSTGAGAARRVENRLDSHGRTAQVASTGAGGGEVVAMGPPDRIVNAERSHTARFLRDFLNGADTRAARSRA